MYMCMKVYLLLSNVVFLILASLEKQIECYSCFQSCELTSEDKFDASKCDCIGNTTCIASACFVKVDIFPKEHVILLQKGCITEIPGGKEGCQFAGQYESVHCFCDGHLCNTRLGLNNYTTNPLPKVECCECTESQGDVCPNKQCLRKCTGNYCLIDFDGLDQGCGVGYSRLYSFLRIKNYDEWQGETTCAKYQTTLSTAVHGCTCTNPNGICNEVNKTRSYQLRNVIERKVDKQNYCYSLHVKSSTTFGEEVYRKSLTCEGQYCFFSLTTSEAFIESTSYQDSFEDHKDFIGSIHSSYEIIAGCLKTDNDVKIGLGCTTEFTTNISNATSRHCICSGHLCNYYHLRYRYPLGQPIGKRGRLSAQGSTSHSIFAFNLFYSIFIVSFYSIIS